MLPKSVMHSVMLLENDHRFSDEGHCTYRHVWRVGEMCVAIASRWRDLSDGPPRYREMQEEKVYRAFKRVGVI